MERIYSLDVLRGVAITIMLFLDAPPDKIYTILEHAAWSGLTVPDLALPMFAFAMGAGAAISMSKREPTTWRILKRAAIMFAIGLALNVLPSICSLLFIDGFGLEKFFDAAIVHERLFGIIQRLAVTYVFGIFIARAIRNDRGILMTALLLLTISSSGFHLYAPDNPFDEGNNISRAVDYLFPGANHIYTPTHDPEGLYGALAGTASVLFGFLAGRILVSNVMISAFNNAEAKTQLHGDFDKIVRDKVAMLGATGAALLIVGDLWSFADVISKKLWTAPFALINAGIDFLLLAVLTKLFEMSRVMKEIFQPLCALGTNPLFFFVANNVVIIFLFMIPDGIGGIYMWLYRHTTQGFISPEFGATLFCAIWALLWLPLAEIFYRMKIVIKI